jgi:hypothetical protein
MDLKKIKSKLLFSYFLFYKVYFISQVLNYYLFFSKKNKFFFINFHIFIQKFYRIFSKKKNQFSKIIFIFKFYSMSFSVKKVLYFILYIGILEFTIL